MNRSGAIGVGVLVGLVLLLAYWRPRFTSTGATTTPATNPPSLSTDPVVPPPTGSTSPRAKPTPPPSVAKALDTLNREIDAGGAAVRALKELLDVVEKGPSADTDAKMSALGGQLAGFKLREQSPLLARCVDEVLNDAALPPEALQGVSQAIAEFGSRAKALLAEITAQLARIAAMRGRPAAPEALVGLEAEALRYQMTLRMTETTAEAESNRSKMRRP